MPYCTSCGSPIPDGQGSSCSMCYGDPAHGSDGYYEEWLRQQADQAAEAAAAAQAQFEADVLAQMEADEAAAAQAGGE